MAQSRPMRLKTALQFNQQCYGMLGNMFAVSLMAHLWAPVVNAASTTPSLYDHGLSCLWPLPAAEAADHIRISNDIHSRHSLRRSK